MKHRIAAVAVVALAGCSEPRYELDGVVYCVPEQYILPSPFIVPNGQTEDRGRGFAVKGCWLPAKDPLEGCVFPREVITLGITQPENAPVMIRSGFGPGSFVDDFMRSPQLISTPLSDGWVATSVPEISGRHYVWELSRDSASATVLGDEGGVPETLVATCEDGLGPADFPKWCKRTTMLGGIALSYTFRSTGLSPAVVEDLDARLRAGLVRLRCP